MVALSPHLNLEEYQMESDNVVTSQVASSIKGGIPGMRGVEHIGLTVPNLEEATEFFVDVIGCEVV